MAQSEFDIIVVGAGIAGASCALACARLGLTVLLLERGEAPGAKNLSGGRLYEYALAALLPEGYLSAPLDREIVQESLSLLSADAATTFNYQHSSFPDNLRSWSIQRARFDPWLAQQAVNAGAELLCSVCVEELIQENGRICGVRLEGETVTANNVVLAEGTNTLLAEHHGLISKPPSSQVGLGVKETLALSSDEIESRFGLEHGLGAAWLFTGGTNEALPGGGFIYTHRQSLSFGAVAPLSSLTPDGCSLNDYLTTLKNHPKIRPLLRNTERVEFGAHLLPEGGLSALPGKLAGNGWWLAGDSARFCINTGFTVRGMDMAILSALAIAECLAEPDSGQDNHYRYREKLKRSALWAILERYRQLPGLLAEPALYRRYPELAAHILREIYQTGPLPPSRLAALCWRHARRDGLFPLMSFLLRSARCL